MALPLPSRRAVLRLLLLAALALASAALAPAPAAAASGPVFGYGDQNTAMFSDERWQELPLKRARRLVDWDTNKDKQKAAKLDAWMAAAKEAGATPLLAIDRSYTKAKRRAPTIAQYRSLLGWLRDRYPWWKELTPWNEANHNLQPTWKNPKLAAAFYRHAKRICKGCKVTSPVILANQRGTTEWIRTFKRETGGKVRLWAVHAYGDHNRGTDRTLRQTIGQLPGQIWVTEAAGWVKFLDGSKWPYNETRAAKAVDRIFITADKHRKRITRWYFYQWLGNLDPEHRWDSGVLDYDGSPRKGYYRLKKGLERARGNAASRRAIDR